MKPLVRWTIGPVKEAGYDCLVRSITAFTQLYDVDVAICYNGHGTLAITPDILLVNQSGLGGKGVSWKLYPPRLDINRHELFIDNDLIIEKHIDEIERFFASDFTLLMQAESRGYGRFENHVPKGYCINSGLFGVPPGFDFGKYLRFYGEDWEQNSGPGRKLSFTYDEQGLVALALLDYSRHVIVDTITNCEWQFNSGNGMHFIGLNYRERHRPYLEYKFNKPYM